MKGTEPTSALPWGTNFLGGGKKYIGEQIQATSHTMRKMNAGEIPRAGGTVATKQAAKVSLRR